MVPLSLSNSRVKTLHLRESPFQGSRNLPARCDSECCRLRGGCNLIDETEDEILSSLKSLTLSTKLGMKNAREDIDRVIGIAKDLKNTLRSANENADYEESSQGEMSGEHSSDNVTITDQIQAMLNTEGEYDDIFDEEGSIVHRDKVLEEMRQFDIKLDLNLTDEDALKKLSKINEIFDKIQSRADNLQYETELVHNMLERQQPSMVDRKQESVIYVGSNPTSNQRYFPSLSDAVNQSHSDQTVQILPGHHSVGNAMCRFGLQEDSTQIEWPNVLHLPRKWRVRLTGDPSAVIDGRIVTMESSYAAIETLSMVCYLKRNNSPVWGKNALSGCEERKTSGTGLLHIFGSLDLYMCNLTINGGACLICFGGATVNFNSCCLGGFRTEDKTCEVGQDLDESSIMLRYATLMSDSQPQASQGVAAFNHSKIHMQNCQVQDVWNGGVSLYQNSEAVLEGCQLRRVGYGVGVDDAAIADVTSCTIHLGSDPLLQTGAFYAMTNSSAATLRSESNEIHGNTWIGRRRPGNYEAVPSEAGPDVDDVVARLRRRGNARQTDADDNEWDEEGELDQGELDSMLADLNALKDQLAETVPPLAQLER
jgi:hypothetical protein